MPNAQEHTTTGEPTSFAELRHVASTALRLERSGHVADALRLVDAAQRSLATIDIPRTREGADALNQLGMTLFEAGYVRAAEPLYDRSLSIAEGLSPAQDDLVEDLLNNLGQAHDRLGDGKRARSLLERAAEMRERRAPDTVGHATILDNLGSVYARLGELARAEDHHRRAFMIFQRERGPFDPHVAVTLGNLSGVFAIRRDLDRAEAFRLRALETQARTRGLTSPETLHELSGLVAIYLDKGDQEGADRLVNHALTIGGATPQPEHRFLAEILGRLSQIAFGEFRLDLAERLGARAVALLEALEGPAAPETLKAVHMLANVQRATHDLDHAEQNYRHALEGFERSGDPDTAVTVSIDLAKIYRERGAYRLAEMVLDNAIKHLREMATPDPSLLTSALGNLAQLYYEAGQHERADGAYAAALDAIKDAKVDVERPWLLHGRALLNYHLGRYETARDLYAQALGAWIEKKGADHPFVATTSANLALAHWAVGDTDRALAAFEAAADRRERDMRRILAVGSERKRLLFATGSLDDLHKVVSFLFTIPERADVSRFATRVTLQRKGLVLDAIAHTFAQVRGMGGVGELSADDQGLIDRLQTVRTEIAGVVTPSPVAPHALLDAERLARLQQEEEQLEASLSYRGALQDPDLAPVTLESVQGELPADAALIELLHFRRFNPTRTGADDVWAESHYAALVLRATGEPTWVDLGNAAGIDTKADQLRRLVRNHSTPVADYERAATELYAQLFAPLEGAIAGSARLIVSPDGKLSMVPLGILRDAGGRALASRFAVSYAAAGREIQVQRAAPAASGVVVIAAPDYDVAALASSDAIGDRFADRGAFEPLPGARAEAQDLDALLGGVTVLEGAAATADAVRVVEHPAVLHIATHGFFSPIDDPEPQQRLEFLPVAGGVLVEQRSQPTAANPMFFSGLAFAGANKRAPGTSTGILTAQEIAGLDLHGTELVVLSACETGLGAVGRGTEFTGMRRALSIAGAATQVTSLWRIGDQATRALMRHFYGFLVQGVGRAEALARAQEAVARDPDHPDWAHPFYWAAFVLSGAWTPMGDTLARRLEVPNGGGVAP
jgi:CHAT domain-containing protein/Tfp pilus assembly protein PilF/Flp pilus assembly protein TadD